MRSTGRRLPRTHTQRSSRPGAALHLTAAAGALLAAALAGAVSMSSSSSSSSSAPAYPTSTLPGFEVVDPAEMALLLHRVGLSPETLAAAGVTAQETSALIGHARTYLEENAQAIRAADESFFAAREVHDALKRRVQSGLASQADLANLETAATSLTSAGSARDAARSGLYNAAVEGIGGPKLQILATLKANKSWELPLQYRADSRSEQEWVALRNALANVRIAEQNGEEPSQEAAQLILTAQSGPGTSAASAGLQSLQTVQNAWEQAVTP